MKRQLTPAQVDRRYLRFLSGTFAMCILMLACLFIPLAGCNDADLERWKTQVTSAQVQLNDAKTEFDNLTSQNNALEQMLAEAQAAIPADDPVAQAEWQEKVDALREKLDGITGRLGDVKQRVDLYTASLNGMADRIKEAKTGEEAIGSAVGTVGGLIGAIIGQPGVSGAAALAGSLITWLGSRRKLKLAGAAAVASGIEAARDDELEKLPQLDGKYLVVEKAGAAIAHKSTGVHDAIKRATD